MKLPQPIEVGDIQGAKWRFHVLVERLNRLHRVVVPNSIAPGEPGPLNRESVRLRAARSLSHPEREIVRVDEGRHPDGTPRYEVELAFLGLYGPASPFEVAFTADIVQREHGERVASFLDIINHRAASLMFQAITSARWWMALSDQPVGDPWLDWVNALAVDAQGLLPPDVLARTAALWYHRPRGIDGLERVLKLRFPGIPVRIDAGVPRSVSSPSRLGNARLGRGLLLGERTLTTTASFHVTLGPLEETQLGEVRAAGGHTAVEALVAAWCDGPQAFEVKIVALAETLQSARLAAPPGGSRLGAGAILGRATEDGPVRSTLR